MHVRCKTVRDHVVKKKNSPDLFLLDIHHFWCLNTDKITELCCSLSSIPLDKIQLIILKCCPDVYSYKQWNNTWNTEQYLAHNSCSIITYRMNQIWGQVYRNLKNYTINEIILQGIYIFLRTKVTYWLR